MENEFIEGAYYTGNISGNLYLCERTPEGRLSLVVTVRGRGSLDVGAWNRFASISDVTLVSKPTPFKKRGLSAFLEKHS